MMSCARWKRSFASSPAICWAASTRFVCMPTAPPVMASAPVDADLEDVYFLNLSIRPTRLLLNQFTDPKEICA